MLQPKIEDMSKQGQETMDKLLSVRIIDAMYCVKCRVKQENIKAQEMPMRNGKIAWKGVCPVCQTRMYRL